MVKMCLRMFKSNFRLLVFVEYLSGPSLCMELTNWSNILGSYSDMNTSPGSK